MPRGLTAAMKAEAAKRLKAPVFFFDVALPAGTVRAWTGPRSVTTLGATWSGIGEFGVVDGIQGSRDLEARDTTIALVGVPADNFPGGAVASTRAIRYQGSVLNVYLSFANPDTYALLMDPVIIRSGFADVMAFAIGETVSCSLSCRDLASLLRFTNGNNMSTASHNARLGNPVVPDYFFEQQDRTAGVPRQVLK